jgi:hypothetical protein
MKNNLIGIGLALVVGAGLTWFIMRGRDVKENTNDAEERVERVEREAQKDIDSLTSLIFRERKKRRADSALAEVRILAKEERIKKLLRNANVKVKTYTDPELDSIIDVLVTDPNR